MLESSWSWKFRVRSRAVAGAIGRGFVENWRWISRLRVGGVPPALARGRLSISLVVVALLFCHGVFGYAHQLVPVEAPAAHASHVAHVAHVAGGQQHGEDQGAEKTHLGDTYFATLLLVLLATALLLGAGVSAGTKLPVPTLLFGGHRFGRFPPPRGPTLPLLQVFRH